MKSIQIVAVIVGVAVAVAISAAVASSINNQATTVQSSNEVLDDMEIFPMTSAPYGKSYGDWTGEVWRHFQEVPLDNNPADDSTGEFCDVNQEDSNVWFLVGTFGGKQERECTVPSDRALVVLVAGVSCSYAEDPSLKTEDDLRQCAEGNTGEMTLRASIDGKAVSNVEDYFSVSPVFPVEFPENNVWGVEAGQSEFVAAGWTLVIKPLSEGEHTIQFSAEEQQDLAVTGEPVWSTEAVYHITVTS